MASESARLVVIGGGLAGMSAAIGHGNGAVVLEQDARPGGLVRTDPVDGFWFDRVLHLLHFRDASAEATVHALLGSVEWSRMTPDAWVVTAQGTARFPIQNHIGHLSSEAAVACLVGLLEARNAEPEEENYEATLRASFGEPLFDLFFGPYNRKQWGVPLSSLVANRVLWNLHRPSLSEAVRGAIRPPEETRTYNHRALYPRPPEDAPWRGMELVSRALARSVPDLRLGHQVVGLDLDRKEVRVQTAQGVLHISWQSGVIATAPLPQVLRFCKGLPQELRNAVLPWNGVSSVALRVRGRRPDLGTWRYYPSPDVSFTRLIFLHEFDPGLAPAHGWPLLAEVVWRGEDGPPEPEALANRVVADARRVGVLAACDVLGASVQVVAPAYARFERGVEEVVNAALVWLRERNVHPLGRYGRWEYSSMQHALTDGLALGRALREAA